ncbi:MAG: NUDIX domain-containing protein [Patescibacteria group bacterium]
MNTHLLADIPVKALIIKDGRVLITKDKRWELPGGRMNVGEGSPEVTLHREVEEELGVKVTVLGLQDVFLRTESDPVHVLVVYRCALLDETPFQVDEEEIKDMRWISQEDDLSTIDFFPGYLAMLERYFQK